MNSFGWTFRLLLVGYNMAIVYFTIVPPASIEILPVIGRPILGVGQIREGAVVHFLMTFLLTLVWALNGLSPRSSVLRSLVTGLVIEFIQIFIPWRRAALSDLFFNAIGSMGSYLAIQVDFKRSKLIGAAMKKTRF